MVDFSKVDTIILDLDNTLFVHDLEAEIQADINYLNIKNTEQFKKEMKIFWPKVSKVLKGKKITKERFCNAIENLMPILKKENISSDKMLEAICRKTPLDTFNSTVELLKVFKEKWYSIVALTDWFRNDQIKNLVHLNIDEYFDEVYGWDNSFSKPHKMALEKIIKENEKTKYIMIGDNLHADIQCANRVGIQSIWINLYGVKPSSRIKPTLQVSSLTELLEKIK